MFVNFACYFPLQQQLGALLQTPQCELETILSAEGILSEIKGIGSNNFAEFILKHPEMYQRMINYIIKFEDELVDKKSQIQYPFISSEILSSSNQKLIDFLFERPENGITIEFEMIRSELFDQFLRFVKQDVLNYTSAGYFSKVFQSIIKARGYDVWQVISNNVEILSDLIKHIEIKHIAEIIDKLIILDTVQEFQEENYLYERKNLLQRIIILISKKYYCIDIVDNVCEILIEICQKSMCSLYYHNPDIIPFVDQIRRPEFFFDISLQTQRAAPIQVLISLVELALKEQHQKEDQLDNQENDLINQNRKNFSIFENILPELPLHLLDHSQNLISYKNSYGLAVQPFGLAKMKLLKLVAILVLTNEFTLVDTLIEAGLIWALKKICIQQSSNNPIHCLSFKIITSIINMNQEDLTEKILIKNSILQFIVDYNTPENLRFGFTGFLTQLSNYLIDKSFFSQQILSYLQSDQKWLTYVETILNSKNSKEKPFLCDINPKEQPEDSDDKEDIDEILRVFCFFNLQQKFQDSQTINTQQKQALESPSSGLNNNFEDNTHISGGKEQLEAPVIHTQNSLNVKLQQSPFESSFFWKIEYDQQIAQQVLDNYE